jgi:polycomb protein EED
MRPPDMAGGSTSNNSTGKVGAILGSEAAVGSLTATKKREYRVTNKLHEGKRPLYAISFNFLDARYYDVFASAGGNRVCIFSFFIFQF